MILAKAYAIWLVVGLCSGLFTMFLVSELKYPSSADAIDIERGANLFSQKCLSCHAISPNKIGGLGPNLSNIGAIASEKVENQSGEEYILRSIIYPNEYRGPEVQGVMPADLVSNIPEKDIRSLVGYVTSLGSAPSYKNLLALRVPELNSTGFSIEKNNITGSMRRAGHEHFLSYGCNNCHGIYAFPGDKLLAPSLSNAGKYPTEYLRESILYPSLVITPTYEIITITHRDGSVISGRLLERNSAGMIVLTNDTNTGHLEKQSIGHEDILASSVSKKSAMPEYRIDDQIVDELIAFLKMLSGGV